MAALRRTRTPATEDQTFRIQFLKIEMEISRDNNISEIGWFYGFTNFSAFLPISLLLLGANTYFFKLYFYIFFELVSCIPG